MNDRLNPGFVAAHVIYVGMRTPAESDQLAGMLLRSSWFDDRYDPIAVEWLRRWKLEAMPRARLDCSCVEGRCAVCN